MTRYNYDELKKYIEDNSKCVLLSIEDTKNNRTKLNILCSICKTEILNIYLSSFKRGQYICKKCKHNSLLEERIKNITAMGYKIIYINQNDLSDRIAIKDNMGYCYLVLYKTILNNKPWIVHPSNPYTIQNIHLWCKLNDKSFNLVSQEYKNAQEKLKWQCLKDECGEIFEANWDNILHNHECGCCTGQQVGLSNCLATKNPELAKQWHPTKNGNLTSYNVTYGSSQYVWWQCKECDHEWFARIADRNNGKGCPQCAESKGEKQLDLILSKYNIPHDRQYEFNNLIGIGGGLLRFDAPVFWDEEKTKLKILIEYDGEFHFKKQYKNDGFETLKIHDEMKNQYCKNNKIPLLRIPYWDYDNIEEILLKQNIICI